MTRVGIFHQLLFIDGVEYEGRMIMETYEKIGGIIYGWQRLNLAAITFYSWATGETLQVDNGSNPASRLDRLALEDFFRDKKELAQAKLEFFKILLAMQTFESESSKLSAKSEHELDAELNTVRDLHFSLATIIQATGFEGNIAERLKERGHSMIKPIN